MALPIPESLFFKRLTPVLSLFESTELKNLSRYVSSYLGGLQSLCMEVDGEDVRYLDGGQGETIIFIHGLLGSKTQWRSMMQAYTRRYRVVALDLPGLGHHHAFASKRHSLNNLSTWLDKIITRLRVERVHLVCHSMGCSLGAYYAATYPERVASTCFLAFPNIFGDRGETFRVMVREFHRAIESDNLDAVVNYYRKSYANSPNVPNIVMRYHLREIRKQRERILKSFREVFDSSVVLMVLLRQIQIPCLIINGDQDYICELTDSSFWEMNVGEHTFVTLRNCGHMVPLEKPDEVIFEHRMFLKHLQKIKPKPCRAQPGLRPRYSISGQ